MNLLGLFNLTKEALAKWVLLAFTSAATALGVSKLAPDMATAANGIIAILAGLAATKIANWLHLQDPPTPAN